MLLGGKVVTELTESDLRALGQHERECKVLEFKVQLPANRREHHKEFLYDVSSFANASGGHLLYGVDEQAGVAVDFPGLSLTDPDKEIQCLENITRDGVRPRMPGVAFHPVQLANGKYVLIAEVPKSWASPHMVTLRGARPFHSRNSVGRHPLDVDEIRAAFLLSSTLTERIRDFRVERLAKIVADELPVRLPDSPKIVLHAIPIDAFATRGTVDIGAAMHSQHWTTLTSLASSRSRINIDGLLAYSSSRSGLYEYQTQLFRSGIIETVVADLSRGVQEETKTIWHKPLEETILRRCFQILALQKELGLALPILVFCSLLGVSGYRMSWQHPAEHRVIDRDTLLVPEVWLDAYPETLVDVINPLKPMFDDIWNASGWESWLNYATCYREHGGKA